MNLTIVSEILLGVSLYIVVIFRDFFGHGAIGIVLTYALPLPDFLTTTLFCITSSELNGQCRRCNQFTEIDSEKYNPEEE